MYIEQTKKIFCDHFLCGLCLEATKEESRQLGLEASMEDALLSHMKICIKFNTFILTMVMYQNLHRNVELGAIPKPKGRLWQQTAFSKNEIFITRGQ
jgi:hypothetical protein